MKNLLMTLLFCLLLTRVVQSQVNRSFIFDGINRTWIVYLPANYTQGSSLP